MSLLKSQWFCLERFTIRQVQNRFITERKNINLSPDEQEMTFPDKEIAGSRCCKSEETQKHNEDIHI